MSGHAFAWSSSSHCCLDFMLPSLPPPRIIKWIIRRNHLSLLQSTKWQWVQGAEASDEGKCSRNIIVMCVSPHKYVLQTWHHIHRWSVKARAYLFFVPICAFYQLLEWNIFTKFVQISRFIIPQSSELNQRPEMFTGTEINSKD